jgi:D-lactate dehydrogenase
MRISQSLIQIIHFMHIKIARLMTFPNVLITGHQAFLTHEALAQIAQITLQNLDELVAGSDLTNEVKWKSEA